MKRLIRLCEYLLFLLFLGIIIFTKDKLATLFIIPLILLIYLFTKKVKIKRYELFIFILALTIRLFTILVLNVEIADDFKTMYEASLSFIKGNLTFMNNTYFKTYSYQLGHVLYQAGLLKIVNNVIILKIANSLITSFIVLFIYLISKKIFNEKYAKIISLSYIFYFYPLYLNSILTNQHLPALFILIVIYLIITKEESTKLFLIIAILLGIANILRTESIIIILGIILYNIAYTTKKNYKYKIKNMAALLIAYLLITNVALLFLNISPLYKNINKERKVENSTIIWKLYCGLNTEYNGIYNIEDDIRYSISHNKKDLLIKRIKKDKFNFPILFLKKEVILWTQTNYDLRITNHFNKKLYDLLLKFNQGFLNIILLLFTVSLYPKKEETKKEIIFIKLLIGIYFGVYLFIEISPRYAYILHMLIFILLAASLQKLEKLKEKFTHK